MAVSLENTELEESSMNGVSNRKKSFLDELIRNYANFIMVLAGILYFTIAGIIGNAVLKSGNISTRVIKDRGNKKLLLSAIHGGRTEAEN